MDVSERNWYVSGYYEGRWMVVGRLREILMKKSGFRKSIAELLAEIEHDEREDCWRNAQEEEPGITRERYEREMKEEGVALRSAYQTRDDLPKLRLIENPTAWSIKF